MVAKIVLIDVCLNVDNGAKYEPFINPWMIRILGTSFGVTIKTLKHLNSPSHDMDALELGCCTYDWVKMFHVKIFCLPLYYDWVFAYLVFLLLYKINMKNPRKEVNAVLKKEAAYFGDIVILPFMDRYELVVLKTIAICEFGVSFCIII